MSRTLHEGDEIRVKIEGDGTWAGTHVYDAETGARIRGVSHIEIRESVGKNPELQAHLTVFPVTLSLAVPAQIAVDGLCLDTHEERGILNEVLVLAQTWGELPDATKAIIASLRRRLGFLIERHVKLDKEVPTDG